MPGDLNRAILGNEVHIGTSGECANRFGGNINRYVIKILIVPTHYSAKVLDCGQNPGAIGIKFYSNNTGLMQDVRIRGNGACGLDLSFNDQNGPLLIQDVEIDVATFAYQSSPTYNIPFDNTIPQVTEGYQYTTFTITPKKSGSELHIDISIPMSASSSGQAMIGALFDGLSSNAVATGWSISSTSHGNGIVLIRHRVRV